MAESLRVALLAGEASGDILGAGLMKGLRNLGIEVSFSGIGGPHMEKEGLTSLVPMERLSVMGLVEPLKRLPELLRIRKQFYQTLKNDPPDVFVGIDSPDFNLDLEKRVKALGIPTVHYVSPSVWAWRQGRIRKIKQAVDLILALFPFEEAFYKTHGVPVCCTGHPLADEFPLVPDITAAREGLDLDQEDKVLAVLPGSREGEVQRLAPVFLDTVRLCNKQWPGLKTFIPCANPQRKKQIDSILKQSFSDLDVTLIDGHSRQVMTAADCLLMASGTASLEGMLLKKPMVVAYRMAPISYAIISRMLKAPYISLPNLLAEKELVPEILQNDVRPDRLFAEILRLLNSNDDRQEILDTWQSIHLDLQRDANATAATAVLDLCRG
jgi:lipid-A-disaccharide synthase